MTNYEGKQTVNSRSLSLFIGSHLMPDRSGRPQRGLSAKEAWDIAVEEEKRRKDGQG